MEIVDHGYRFITRTFQQISNNRDDMIFTDPTRNGYDIVVTFRFIDEFGEPCVAIKIGINWKTSKVLAIEQNTCIDNRLKNRLTSWLDAINRCDKFLKSACLRD